MTKSDEIPLLFSSIVGRLLYVVDTKNTLVGPVGPFQSILLFRFSLNRRFFAIFWGFHPQQVAKCCAASEVISHRILNSSTSYYLDSIWDYIGTKICPKHPKFKRLVIAKCAYLYWAQNQDDEKTKKQPKFPHEQSQSSPDFFITECGESKMHLAQLVLLKGTNNHGLQKQTFQNNVIF